MQDTGRALLLPVLRLLNLLARGLLLFNETVPDQSVFRFVLLGRSR